jgi:hypothetical protein
MNRITFPMLMLGLSLAPIVGCETKPSANQSPASAAEPQSKASHNDAAQLKAAQDERIKVLTQIVETVAEQQKTGTVDVVDQLFSAESELCDALLDSTNEPEKRVALLTKQLDKANDFVKVLQARGEAGKVLLQDVLRAKSQYLGVKIKLLRERSKKRPPTPNPTGKQS